MRILVISDIHAYAVAPEGRSKPSHVKAGDNSALTPVTSLTELFDKGEFPKPDVVLSPGDLGDRAEPAATDFAWKFLQGIAARCTSKTLIAATGNHDVDSRYLASDFDPKGQLLQLKPHYPLTIESDNTSTSGSDRCENYKLLYWAKNFCIHRINNYRFVILNSAAYHGHGETEHEHGRISAYTLEQLKEHLRKDNQNDDTEPALNILLCHHHLEKDGTITDTDYSSMQGAHALLDFLRDPEFGRWFVIHGHRHRSRLFQALGSSGPYVLSAGSFGATRDKDYENTSPNQIHLIHLKEHEMKKFYSYPAGNIQTWTWTPAIGWLSDKASSGGLPPSTNFGFRGPIESLAERTRAIVNDTPVGWESLVQSIPELSICDHQQISDLKKILDKYHNIYLVLQENGLPYECGRKK